MKNKSGNTAFGAAAVRLIEQYEPEDKRLFNDQVIYHLTSSVLRFILKYKFVRNYFTNLSEKIIPGIIGEQICRTKYIDEKTLAVLKEVQQILILGAGLDTRAYRLEGCDDKIFYEIDFSSIQKIKKQKLKKYLGNLPSTVQYIPIDFNKEKIETVLNNTPFDFNKPTLVILEGVTQYITKEAVEEVFTFIAKLVNNSYLIFTYILRDVIDRKTASSKKIMDWSEKKNCPFLFGINQSEIKTFLENYNLEMLEDVGPDFHKTNYLKSTNRDIEVYEGERTNFSKIKK